MDWPFNLSKKGIASDPFGDYDGDGLQNLNDCRPKNPKKQDVAGSIAMGAAGQQMDALNQQKVVVPSQPKDEIIIVATTPKALPISRVRTTRTQTPHPVMEMRGPMGKETTKIEPSRLGVHKSPMLSSQ